MISVHNFIYLFVSSFMALFPVINPIGSGFIVNGFLEGLNNVERKTAIKKIIVNCLFIGLGSLILGHLILSIFGLAIPVIQVGGGILICKTGWVWLSDSGSKDTDADQHEKIDLASLEKKLFYPITFPITIGAGTMSVIFTLMATANVKNNLLDTVLNYLMITAAIVAMCIILYIFLIQGDKIDKKLGPIGNLIINKLVAFFTFSTGIQIIVTGISKIFHLSIL